MGHPPPEQQHCRYRISILKDLIMHQKYYVAMACDAGGYGQSDYLYLIRLDDGRLLGYADEFEVVTFDIEDACSRENYRRAKWSALPVDDSGWRPATLDEIKSLGLEKCLIGSKADMKVKTPIDPI
jgi:hypothetical protein